jgi:two-component system LytT family response regulator
MSKTINAIIVDDEQRARDVLSTLLEKHCPNVLIHARCKDVEEAVESIKTHQPDVVFLDIEMPRYAGYEIVEFFDEINFEIIFVTAYDHYAIKAFELSAIDYLLKPIEIKRLKESVGKLEEKIGSRKLEENYQLLVESLKKEKTEKLIIPINREQKILYLDDILAIEAKESYSVFHCNCEGKFMVSKNLKHYESILEGTQFYRCHKSWLINTDKIQSYSKKKLEINLGNDLIAKLSKYKKPDFESDYLK